MKWTVAWLAVPLVILFPTCPFSEGNQDDTKRPVSGSHSELSFTSELEKVDRCLQLDVTRLLNADGPEPDPVFTEHISQTYQKTGFPEKAVASWRKPCKENPIPEPVKKGWLHTRTP